MLSYVIYFTVIVWSESFLIVLKLVYADIVIIKAVGNMTCLCWLKKVAEETIANHDGNREGVETAVGHTWQSCNNDFSKIFWEGSVKGLFKFGNLYQLSPALGLDPEPRCQPQTN